ncbi:MAG: PGPGW domain-containing protein [Pseudomonadota bacterium]|nr:tellurium resistance protein TerC [Alteromonadaceae bacterium]MDY6926609.1 PGPGW domain-containing protein [Pseudomonadota bacterium]RPH18663.1 MAG: tellurium resistance protein TerC [Alteromonadaceae bacterium TMED7]|tara:strand:- start:12877 stop:13110 length:234 start_codon:yes stop_codon:yes gene_type:complete
MKKTIRLSLGAILFLTGIVLTLLPGSILLVIGGLMLLSYDWPRARSWLRFFQNQMARSARRLDQLLLNRKLSRSRIR